VFSIFISQWKRLKTRLHGKRFINPHVPWGNRMTTHMGGLEVVAAPAATAELKAGERTAAAVAAIHRQLHGLKNMAAVSSMDNELYIAVAMLVDYAHDMIDDKQYQYAYEFIDGVKLMAIHLGDAKLERAARAVRKMIRWTVDHMEVD